MKQLTCVNPIDLPVVPSADRYLQQIQSRETILAVRTACVSSLWILGLPILAEVVALEDIYPSLRYQNVLILDAQEPYDISCISRQASGF